jgi:pimeloyl-ACP methyl ester carboxylesterase
VVALPSPVSANFIVAATENGVPGHAFEDAADLYRVMEAIWARLEDKLEVTHFDLAGYSLGAFNAAFVARLDQDRQVFNFRRVLMMNPPLRLYSSISLLDRMLENIPGGEDNFNLFFEDLFNAFSQAYQLSDTVQFNEELLYKAFENLHPTDELLAALIGVVFRLASANMAFTSDVMTNFGYIKPSNVRLTKYSDTKTYEKVSMRLGFTDYFHAYFYPYHQALDPDLSRGELIELMSLATIEEFLTDADNIFMMHNADDLILEAGEIDLLMQMFGDRGKVFPYGGHMGNMEHVDYIGHMLNVMTGDGR